MHGNRTRVARTSQQKQRGNHQEKNHTEQVKDIDEGKHRRLLLNDPEDGAISAIRRSCGITALTHKCVPQAINSGLRLGIIDVHIRPETIDVLLLRAR